MTPTPPVVRRDTQMTSLRPTNERAIALLFVRKRYSDSPAVLRASSRVKYSRPLAILPSRIVKTIA